MENLTLNELRELNSGANPERIDGSDVLAISEGILTDIEGHVYERTDCKTEVEYIVKFPKEYGVVLGNVFYKLL